MGSRLKLNNKCILHLLDNGKKKLSEENFGLMRKEYKLIDLLYHISEFPIQAPTLQWLAPKAQVGHVYSPTKRTLQFKLGNRVVEFGQTEFALITGLTFGPYEQLDENVKSDFISLFEVKGKIKFDHIIKLMDTASLEDNSSIICRKLVVIYLMHGLVMHTSQKGVVGWKMVLLANDANHFNSFQWGRLIYDEIVQEWAAIANKCLLDEGASQDSCHDASHDAVGGIEEDEADGNEGTEGTQGGKKGKIVQYTLTKFPFAIQAWILESLDLEHALVLAKKSSETTIPRIRRWSTLNMNSKQMYQRAKQTIFDFENVSLETILNT